MTRPAAPLGARFLRLTNADLPRLLQLCRSCSDFYALIEGQPPSDETAAELLGPLEDKYARGTRHVWGVEKDGALIAVAELLEGYPSSHDWYIGLLLIAPEHRRQGLGTQLCAGLVRWMGERSASVVRLVVHQQNAGARAFWDRQGFIVEREDLKRSGRLEGPVSILARRAWDRRS
ncbi:MAG TPA: GNAT family N-acetyltransferase [Polyangia bacterium]|jgi:ribosomal protein S18 acetylase RimI-like enzyme|nr:GNAT family N-acetyltransferase [Polyangia bacterium]